MKFKNLNKAIKLISATNIETNSVANIIMWSDVLQKALEENDMEKAKKASDEIKEQANITQDWLRALADQGTQIPISYTDFIHSRE